MSFVELIDGSTLQGGPARLDISAGTRLGRAFGTLLRRRSGGAQVVVLGRGGDDAELALRDGLVRGLLLAGHQVRDLGVASAELFAFALGHLGAAGGALVLPADRELRSLTFFLGHHAITADALVELATLADGDEHAAGQGTLALVDVQGAFRAQAKGAA